MADEYTTRIAQVRSIEPREDVEIALLEAPFDGLIANVTLTPSEDIRGAYYTRSLQLIVHPKVVANLSLESNDVLLPGGEKHNMRMKLPTSSLRVRAGEPLLWSSIGSAGEGLAVPESSVELIFEQKDIPESLSPPELWIHCVPNYWIGKKVLVQHEYGITSSPEHGRGAYSAYISEHAGTFQGADSNVLQVRLDPIEHGRLPRNAGFPWQSAVEIKLIEDE